MHEFNFFPFYKMADSTKNSDRSVIGTRTLSAAAGKATQIITKKPIDIRMYRIFSNFYVLTPL